MSDSGWIWTGEAAQRLRVSANGLRDAADLLGIELREHPKDQRKRVIAVEDLDILREAQERARANRARRAGR